MRLVRLFDLVAPLDLHLSKSNMKTKLSSSILETYCHFNKRINNPVKTETIMILLLLAVNVSLTCIWVLYFIVTHCTL